jgi:SNF2 family DNA or RNA helicase
MTIYIESLPNKQLSIKFDYNQLLVEKIKALPQRRWDAKKKIWKCDPSLQNIEFLQKWFPEAVWHENTSNIIQDIADRSSEREDTLAAKSNGDDLSTLDDVVFKTDPFDHQKIGLLLGRDKTVFAYLMDQGTGKTKLLIDDAAHNYRNGKINGLLVICKNSAKTNWVDPYNTYARTKHPDDLDEIDIHFPPDIEYSKACWLSNKNSRAKHIYEDAKSRWGEEGTFSIFVINYECISHKRMFDECKEFVSKHKTMICIDESTGIKNRSAKRTKNSVKLRQDCKLARIMTGTPIIKSPLNIFSQFNFLDPDIIGLTNYYAFQNHYAVMGGFEGYQVMYYKNLEELTEKINSCSYRVLKKDCLDIPEKMYDKREITMNADQSKAYNTMAEEMVLFIEEHVIDAPIILTQLLRLQQITSGYVPLIDEEGKTYGTLKLGDANPKVEETVSIIKECQHKVIVWCRFINEIKELDERLKEEGIGHVLFYGAVNEADRIQARRDFQNLDNDCQVFIGQVNTGGMGITLTAAQTVVYLSNSFSTEDRVQSEDRAHRIGQKNHVQYLDLIVPGTIDQKIVTTLRENKSISDTILQDGLSSWI